MRPGQRGDLHREVPVERRLDGLLLHQPLVHFQDDLAMVPARLDRDARLRAQLAELFLVGVGGDLLAQGGRDRGIERCRLPLTADVVLAAVSAASSPSAQGGARGVLDQLPGKRGDRVVVAVLRSGLQHRELGLWVVFTLVPEDPADLVAPLDPAHDKPLEVELQRDAQVEGCRRRYCGSSMAARWHHRGGLQDSLSTSRSRAHASAPGSSG